MCILGKYFPADFIGSRDQRGGFEHYFFGVSARSSAFRSEQELQDYKQKVKSSMSTTTELSLAVPLPKAMDVNITCPRDHLTNCDHSMIKNPRCSKVTWSTTYRITINSSDTQCKFLIKHPLSLLCLFFTFFSYFDWHTRLLTVQSPYCLK